MPKPARIDVVPLLPGDQAIPTRGAQASFCGLGSPNVMSPGTFEIALRICERSPVGTVVYS